MRERLILPILAFVAILAANALWTFGAELLAGGEVEGADLRLWVLAAGFFLAHVALPGLLLRACARDPRADRCEEFALAWVLGLVLHGAGFFALRALGAYVLLPWWPCVCLPLALIARARGQMRTQEPLSLRDVRASREVFIAVSLLVVVCIARTTTRSPQDWWHGLDDDQLFHAGNVAEVARTGALLDPRVAGEPLNYHVGAYALPAAASIVTGEASASLAQGPLAALAPVLLALVVFVAARAWAGRVLPSPDRAGWIAAALVVCHTDIALGLEQVGWRGASAWRTQSFLDRGIFNSPSTCLGLALDAAIVWVLARVLVPGGERRRNDLLLLAIFAAAASATKGSVVPVLAGGVTFACVAQGLARRRIEWRWWEAVVVLVVAAAPRTLLLAFGEASYAGAMFRWNPLRAFEAEGLGPHLAGVMGFDSGAVSSWWPFAVLPLCLLVHLGAVAAGAVLACGRGVSSARHVLIPLGSIALVGFGLALSLAAPGYSQLFFAYDATIALAIVAGIGFAAWRPSLRGGRTLTTVVLLFVLLASSLGAIGNLCSNVTRARPIEPSSAREYRHGLDWMRTHAGRDSLSVTSHDRMIVSAFAGARTLFETDRFTSARHAAEWRRVDGAWIPGRGKRDLPSKAQVLRARLFDGVSANESAELSAIAGPIRALYFVVDSVEVRTADPLGTCFVPRSLVVPPWIQADRRLERCFANDLIAIYRLPLGAPEALR